MSDNNDSTTATVRHLRMPQTPVGPIVLVADGDSLAGVYMREHRHAPEVTQFGPEIADDPFLVGVARQLSEYFAGEREMFDVPVSPRGTDFQRLVWDGLREIPYGQTWTYAQLARHIGQPTASRAVGLANGRNPVSIVVPCHRVVGSDGSLTGYGGGLDNKRALLDLERSHTDSALF